MFGSFPLKGVVSVIDVIGSVDNFAVVPSAVLDDSQPNGYRVEQRLQVTLKSASDERTYTIDFRLSEGSEAPSEAQLGQWIESGELVQAFCLAVFSRPFVHREDKVYRSKGKEVQVADQTIAVDAFSTFSGVSMAPLVGGPALDEVVRRARAAYKLGQREYRAQRNAVRAQEAEARMLERVREMKARKDQEAAQAGATAEPAAANGRRRA